MRLLRVIGICLLLEGCAPRPVEVRTAVDRGADVSLTLSNRTSRAVNVYVVTGETTLFLRQVRANSTESLPVRGVAPGARVTLRAVTIDGRQSFVQQGVLAEGILRWTLP